MQKYSLYLADVLPTKKFFKWIIDHEMKLAVKRKKFADCFRVCPSGIWDKAAVGYVDMNMVGNITNRGNLLQEFFFGVDKNCREYLYHRFSSVSIFLFLRSYLSPMKSVSSHFFTIAMACSSERTRPARQRPLVLLCLRESSADSIL